MPLFFYLYTPLKEFDNPSSDEGALYYKSENNHLALSITYSHSHKYLTQITL
jgi:hypothetical protein